MKDSQARQDIEHLSAGIRNADAAIDMVARHLNNRIDELQTTVNLLLGFVNAETFVVPEKPPVPAVPAHVAIRKVPPPSKK